MKEVRRFCDRCGSNILEGGTVLEVKAGELVRRLPESLDFCRA